MGGKNIYMGSNSKIHLSTFDSSKTDKAERFSSLNGLFIRNCLRIYDKKMGEITAKLLNFLGVTTLFFGFISNLPNPISILVGIVSLMWVTYKTLKERENWLYRRSERRKHERDNKTI